MSVVTDVALMFGISEGRHAPKNAIMTRINAFFASDGSAAGTVIGGLVSVDDESLPRGWYGGSKMLQSELLVGAFNYLDTDRFVEHLEGIKWHQPERVAMMLRYEHDDHVRVYRFVGNKFSQV